MKILLAVDGSPQAQEAVEEVTARPWPSGSIVKVISVVQPVVPPAADFAVGTTWSEIWRDQIDSAQQLVSRVVNWFERTACQVETVVRQGDPRTEIIAEAIEWEADLIVVGSHGHSRLERLLLGSVAQSIINRSPCSVEVVRHREPLYAAA